MSSFFSFLSFYFAIWPLCSLSTSDSPIKTYKTKSKIYSFIASSMESLFCTFKSSANKATMVQTWPNYTMKEQTFWAHSWNEKSTIPPVNVPKWLEAVMPGFWFKLHQAAQTHKKCNSTEYNPMAKMSANTTKIKTNLMFKWKKKLSVKKLLWGFIDWGPQKHLCFLFSPQETLKNRNQDPHR